MSKLFTHGDSITAGAITTAANKQYVQLLASQLGATLDNAGISTAMVMDRYSVLCGKAPVAGDMSTIMFGTNDQAKYDASAAKRGYFIDGLVSYTLWMACQPKIANAANGVTFAGAWTNAGLALGAFGSVSVGAKAAFTVNGDAFALGMFRQYNNAGSFRVTVDGADKGTFSNGGDIRTILGASWGPMGLIFSGLGDGPHAVEIEIITGGSTANYTFFHWFCELSSARNKVAIGNIPKAIAYTYGGSAANVDAYNADIARLVAKLSSIGIDARLADVCSALAPPDMYDNVHPNDAGHAKVAAVFKTALESGASTPPANEVTYTPTTVYTGSDGNFYIKTSGGYKRLTLV